jgi:hypothetical protein
MPKQIPLQGGKPIRGGDTPIIEQEGYCGKVPNTALREIEKELHGVLNGDVSLVFFIKDGSLSRFETRGWHCDYSTEGFSGRFPLKAFKLLEWKVTGLLHGTVEVSLAICDGCFLNCTANVVRSFIPGKATTGGCDGE